MNIRSQEWIQARFRHRRDHSSLLLWSVDAVYPAFKGYQRVDCDYTGDLPNLGNQDVLVKAMLEDCRIKLIMLIVRFSILVLTHFLLSFSTASS
jgi:hypothetical protein